MLFMFLVVLAYLMGSICSAVIVCKVCSLPDPRTEGSKNPGATNILRLAGKQYAALVMIADILKGTIPVLIAKALDADPFTIGFTGLAAVLGHMYPAFFEFKGGKGVATAIGALLGLNFILGILVAITWILVAKVSRYSSLASIVSIGLAPFYSLIFIYRIAIFIPLLIMALIILYKHKENITRLIDKTEPKIKPKENIIEEAILEEESEPLETQDKTAAKLPVPETIIEVESVKIIETVVEKPQAKQESKTTKTTNKKDGLEKKPRTTKKTAATKDKTTNKQQEE